MADGSVTGEFVLDPSSNPWPGFGTAARASLTQLDRLIDMDLWLVTEVKDHDQHVVASCGRWSAQAPAGAVFPWLESFCLRMLQGHGPRFVPNAAAVPAYAKAMVGPLAQVHSYIGVPLLRSDGVLFGTLCAFAGTTRPQSINDRRDLVEFMARGLSTLLAKETLAAERSEDAAQAYALAERDPLTGLRNLRGWTQALEQENLRCRRYGSAASVFAVRLATPRRSDESPDFAAANDIYQACAKALTAVGRPADTIARCTGGEFAVLAVECDVICARALVIGIRRALSKVALAATVTGATRRFEEDLAATWRRARGGRPPNAPKSRSAGSTT